MWLITLTRPFLFDLAFFLSHFTPSNGQHSPSFATHSKEADLFPIRPNTTSACTRYHHLRHESIPLLADKYNVSARDILEWNGARLGLEEGYRVCVGVEQPEPGPACESKPLMMDARRDALGGLAERNAGLIKWALRWDDYVASLAALVIAFVLWRMPASRPRSWFMNTYWQLRERLESQGGGEATLEDVAGMAGCAKSSRSIETKEPAASPEVPQDPRPVETTNGSRKENEERNCKRSLTTVPIEKTSKRVDAEEAPPKDSIVKLESEASNSDIEVINTPEVGDAEDIESAWDELAEAFWQYSRYE